MQRICILMVALLLSACAGGMPGTGSPSLESVPNQAAPQPFGSAAYCASTPAAAEAPFWQAFCQADAPATVATLTRDAWNQLEQVQDEVNSSLTYSPTVSWDPLASAGDCKTATARKALELLDKGWPPGALRVATAFVDDHSYQQLAYHTVLLVDTDHGTIVLDSRRSEPAAWQDVSYIWMTAEVPGGKGAWTRLPADPREVQMAMLANASLMQAQPSPPQVEVASAEGAVPR